MKMIHMNVPGSKSATLEGYILDCEIRFGLEKKRPAIVVCPGGGYMYCSPREAEPIALAYAARGFHAFILRYSVGWDAAGFAPLKEVSWTIGYLREHAEEWNIDPEKIISCGFSAGGHLALSAGLLAENKPNAMVLGYPAASAPNMPGMNFMLQLLEGRQDVTDEDAKKYDLVSHITKDAPPVFIAATAQDLLTPYGALPIAQKYSTFGTRYELHVFQYGPHGYALANEVTADGSNSTFDPAYAQWLELSVKWIHRTFGKPELIEKNTSMLVKHMKKLGFLPEDAEEKPIL
jgi:acetyl esterase/lipase